MPTIPGLPDRLKKIVDEKFDGTAAQFYGPLNISGGTFDAYLKGTSIPGGDKLIKLARAGRVTIDWLLTGEHFIIGEEDIAKDEDERKCLNIKRSLNEEDKKQWIKQGMYYLENPTEEPAPSALKSAAKKTSRHSTQTS